MKKHTISVKFALEGLIWCFSSQPNYKIHALLSLIALSAGYIFSISQIEWIVIFLLIFGGFTIETVNTAMEKLGDAITSEYNQHIKRAKDASAGAMLLFAVGSITVAGMIFIPKFISLIR